jgi:hypothetical protein
MRWYLGDGPITMTTTMSIDGQAPATLPWETIDLIQSLLAAVQMDKKDEALALAGQIEPTIDELYAERFFRA